MRHSKLFRLVPWVMVVSACGGGDPVDIGDDRVVKTGEKLSDYAAEWVGYAEAFEFDSGSDEIRIIMDENGQGTLEVGNASPIPPATDPDVGYPERDRSEVGVKLRSGFAYALHEATVVDRRLRLGIDLFELYGDWCSMQTPYLDSNSPPEDPRYDCLPNSSGMQIDGQCYLDDPGIFVDCAKLEMCHGNVCNCTADGCTARSDTTRVRLDAVLQNDGDDLEGTLTVGDNVTVRMTRQ